MMHVAAGLVAGLVLFSSAMAHDEAVGVGDLEISGGFTRATLPGAPVGGGYFTIENTGDADDRLVAAETPVAREVEIHEMALVDDVMTMRALSDGLEIPAGETVSLAPGGYHLMLMGLLEPLVEGESVPLTLTFEQAGSVTVGLDVRPMGARTAEDGDGACHHDGEAGDGGHHHHH